MAPPKDSTFPGIESSFDHSRDSNAINSADAKLFDSAYPVVAASANQNALVKPFGQPRTTNDQQVAVNESIITRGYISQDLNQILNTRPAIAEPPALAAPLDSPQGSRPYLNFTGLRPAGVDATVTRSLTESDRLTLSKLEGAFLHGDIQALVSLVNSVSPHREGHHAEKTYFAHAFEPFRQELALLGFDASYDRRTGALSFHNRESKTTGDSYLKTLVIDPGKQTVFAERMRPANLSRDRISFNWATNEVEEHRTQFLPELKQESSKVSREHLERRYLDLMRDQIDVHIEEIRHEQLDAQRARFEKFMQEQAEEKRRLQEQNEQLERERRLRGLTGPKF
jgi:hypothetical protein